MSKKKKVKGPPPKALTFDALMALSEEEIKAAFPHGATMTPKERWEPTEEGQEPEMPLRALLKAKRERDPVRLMHKDASHPPTDIAEFALGATTPTTRDKRTWRRVEIEPEQVDTKTEDRFVEENEARHETRQLVADPEQVTKEEIRRFTARFRAYAIWAGRHGVDPTFLLQKWERQLTRAEKSAKKDIRRVA